ncbi:MAG: acyl-CoA thioesterase [Paracoccaceae bacterium]
MTDRPSEDAAPRLSDFPFRTFDTIRYADTDRQGHVNNAVFATFVETGRCAFLYDPDAPLAAVGAAFVIAELTLRFRAEIVWPGRVEIGTGVVRVGNSSIGLSHALFQDGRLKATAEAVVVQTDETSRRPRPLSDAAKAFLERYRIDG